MWNPGAEHGKSATRIAGIISDGNYAVGVDDAMEDEEDEDW